MNIDVGWVHLSLSEVLFAMNTWIQKELDGTLIHSLTLAHPCLPPSGHEEILLCVQVTVARWIDQNYRFDAGVFLWIV